MPKKEKYLDVVANYSDRSSLTQLRISSHRLEIELGRRNNIPRPERICKYCLHNNLPNNIESESHFISECDLFTKAREHVNNKIKNILNCSSTVPDLSHPTQLNYMSLINPTMEVSGSLSCENQVHVIRIIARLISTRRNFLESLDKV